MEEKIISERYMLTRKAYITKKELKTILMVDSDYFIGKLWKKLRIEIGKYLNDNDKELFDERLLPTDLVMKYLNNPNLQSQIDKDYMAMKKR